ncbi:hypothetical protein B0H13DRAFT_1897267 [Mycena leptocephala]|nr:hypothetical protein B0H13DRAFT_1897267 [Mycena leptocephala]
MSSSKASGPKLPVGIPQDLDTRSTYLYNILKYLPTSIPLDPPDDSSTYNFYLDPEDVAEEGAMFAFNCRLEVAFQTHALHGSKLIFKEQGKRLLALGEFLKMIMCLITAAIEFRTCIHDEFPNVILVFVPPNYLPGVDGGHPFRAAKTGLTAEQVKFSTSVPVLRDASVKPIVDLFKWAQTSSGRDLIKWAWEKSAVGKYNLGSDCLTSKKSKATWPPTANISETILISARRSRTRSVMFLNSTRKPYNRQLQSRPSCGHDGGDVVSGAARVDG